MTPASCGRRCSEEEEEAACHEPQLARAAAVEGAVDIVVSCSPLYADRPAEAPQPDT